MNNPSKDEILSRVNGLFVELFETPPEKLVPEALLFQDLSLDSLDAIDLVVSFERVFKIRPPHAEIRAIRTLQDVHELVLRYCNEESTMGDLSVVPAEATPASRVAN
ncbi:MAG: acyl carrier protein [Silvanigrellales bacterium]|jgi:acyl carrier protein|nr:acyl carrier protein [Silvanigrellales bacterium]